MQKGRLKGCCHGWQVNVDNIDRDLFGRAVRGAMYQPSDEAAHDMRTAAHDIMHSAYQDNLVRSPLGAAEWLSAYMQCADAVPQQANCIRPVFLKGF